MDMKFKIGDRVKIIRQIPFWGCVCWVKDMDSTLGKIYTIVNIETENMDYQLNTNIFDSCFNEYFDYWYPEESLQKVNEQLMLFNL